MGQTVSWICLQNVVLGLAVTLASRDVCQLDVSRTNLLVRPTLVRPLSTADDVRWLSQLRAVPTSSLKRPSHGQTTADGGRIISLPPPRRQASAFIPLRAAPASAGLGLASSSFGFMRGRNCTAICVVAVGRISVIWQRVCRTAAIMSRGFLHCAL